MPKTDDGGFGAPFVARLRIELDRVQPPSTAPRYMSARPRIIVWRAAPLVLAIALVGILGMTAWAATGSTNPAVWTNRVETVINPPPPSPTPESTPTPAPPAAAAPAPPTHRTTANPTERPTSGEGEHESPDPSPRPSSSPEPGDHSGSSYPGGGAWPSPSPTPSDH